MQQYINVWSIVTKYIQDTLNKKFKCIELANVGKFIKKNNNIITYIPSIDLL